MSKILIAGCGYLGRELSNILISKDHEVWGLKKNPGGLPSKVKEVCADLSKKEALDNLPRDFDYVFYTAAAKEHSEEAYRRIYLIGLDNLLSHLSQSKIKKVVFSSSTSVYAQLDTSVVDESSKTEPDYFSGKIILEAENLLANSAHPSTSLRLGGLYGPERTRLINSVKSKQAKLSIKKIYTNRIHIVDAARMLEHLMQIDEGVYIGVDSSPVPKNEVLSFLAKELGVDKLETEDTPSNRLRSNKRCSNKKIIESGFEFLYPSYVEGYGEILNNLN